MRSVPSDLHVLVRKTLLGLIKPMAPRACLRKVVNTGSVNGWCPTQNLAFERARRAAARFGPVVELRPRDSSITRSSPEGSR
jgi:hypothetical protein